MDLRIVWSEWNENLFISSISRMLIRWCNVIIVFVDISLS